MLENRIEISDIANWKSQTKFSINVLVRGCSLEIYAWLIQNKDESWDTDPPQTVAPLALAPRATAIKSLAIVIEIAIENIAISKSNKHFHG